MQTRITNVETLNYYQAYHKSRFSISFAYVANLASFILYFYFAIISVKKLTYLIVGKVYHDEVRR